MEMKRKVIKQGHNTLTITLPSNWVKKCNVKAGDNLDIEEKQDRLMINHPKNLSSEDNIAKIDTVNLGSFNKNHISVCYNVGYDGIDVNFNNIDIFKMIQRQLSYCTGFEIVNQKESFCKIRNISSVHDEDFEMLLRRTFIMLIELADQTLDAIKKGEYDRLDEIRMLEYTNNKYTCILKRMLYIKGYSRNYNRTHSAYCYIFDIERLADDFKRICDYFCENKNIKASKGSLDYFEEVIKLLRTLYEIYYKFNAEKGRFLLDQGKEDLKQGYDLLKTCSKKESIVIHHLIDNNIRIYEMFEQYLEMTL